ncbi:MAG TPA: AAA family ATPase [Verrucomicrobiae bacterium]|nr:AAA family ATPase [Verrucomicrobiae bacterium]
MPDLLARCKNRLKAAKSGEATGDIHIVCRHWLLIDIDPFRPKGISSTDDEKKQAAILARDIRDYLRGLGWPEPVVADSGNGWHLLYRVALPSNDGGRVQRVLRALSSRFDNDHCKVDKGVFNPSRIVKLYGTLARKGDSLPDRPHRLSRIRSIPVPITTVSQSQLDAFVASHPVTSTPAASTPTSPGRNGQFSLADFLTKHSIAVSGKKPLADGRTAHLLAQCPFDENHGDHGEVAVFESLGGKLGFQCKHNGCEGRGWRDFRKHYEPEYCIDAEWSGGQHEVTVRTLDQFTANEGEASKTLAGKRWLCRGGSVLWCGPTGIGKSSSVMQAAIEWALGRPFFDINPVGNLQVLIIQAENDDGDMAEMRDGIFRGLNLGEEYRVAVCKAILVVCESVATGQEFIVLLTGLVAKCKPDLVIIDPLFAYCGCNVSDQERMSQFLRNGLNPILQANGCGLILVHHTNKPKTGREKPDWQAGDYAYLGSGTAELANWARAVVVIRSIGSHDVFQIVLPKRGKRAGLMDHKGEPRYSFHVKHGSPGICWELASEDDLTTQGKTPRPGKDDLLKLIPDDSSIGMAKLLNLAGDKGIGQNRCRNLLAELREDGRVFEWLTPRPGTNSAKSYSQRPQPECRP